MATYINADTRRRIEQDIDTAQRILQRDIRKANFMLENRTVLQDHNSWFSDNGAADNPYSATYDEAFSELLNGIRYKKMCLNAQKKKLN